MYVCLAVFNYVIAANILASVSATAAQEKDMNVVTGVAAAVLG